MNKSELKELGIETTGQKFGYNIEIFTHNNKVLLFDILSRDNYKPHPATELDFILIKNEGRKKTTQD